MRLLELRELDEFRAVLARHQLFPQDFDLTEVDTTDPKSDELLGLQGMVTVTRIQTRRSHDYCTGDGTDWVGQFARDLDAGRYD